MSLHDWLKNSWLIEHSTSLAEIEDLFAAFRKKRNISGYERTGMISDHEVDEMIELATQLRDDVVRWLRKNHPQLLSN